MKRREQPNVMMLLISLALWLAMTLATQLDLRFSIGMLNHVWATATVLTALIVVYHSWSCPQHILKKVLLSVAVTLFMIIAAIAICFKISAIFEGGKTFVQELHVNQRDDVDVIELYRQGVYSVIFEQRRKIFPGLERVYYLGEVRCSGGGYATVTDQNTINYRTSTGDLKGHVIQLHK